MTVPPSFSMSTTVAQSLYCPFPIFFPFFLLLNDRHLLINVQLFSLFSHLTLSLSSVFGEIKSVIGGRAELPCNLTLPSPDDAIQLIFWYRGNASRVPIYTIDSRTATSLVNATHFPSSDIFSPNRATFQLNGSASPQLASLIIEPVEEADHGDYKCRVDFRWSRTISSFVSLHIIGKPFGFGSFSCCVFCVKCPQVSICWSSLDNG